LSELRRNILATLAYFDLFSYPLTLDEVYLFLPGKYNQEDFGYALRGLVADRRVCKFDKYYTLRNDPFLAERREKGNAKAKEMMITAKKVCDLMIRFPYVRGLAISGSLSKNFADEDSDIDLFIITKKNRLWIARTIMHLFKKLTFLVKKEHYFCMNYYIDEQDLEIHEKNIYTATEVATLIPLNGDTIFEQFFAANGWTREYLPNKYMRISTAKPLKMSRWKRFIESIFNGRLGYALDNLLMRITISRWNKKMLAQKRNNHGFILGMDAGKHYTKPDPVNFQNKLMGRYRDRVAQVTERAEGIAVN
jgi:predicted nucleotidyltransferase